MIEVHERTLRTLEKVERNPLKLDGLRMRLRDLYVGKMAKTRDPSVRRRWEKRMWLRCIHPVIEAHRRSRRSRRKKMRLRLWVDDAKRCYSSAAIDSELLAQRLGDLARYQGRTDEARRHYARARNGPAYNALGILARDDGHLLTAAYWFSRAAFANNIANLDLRVLADDGVKVTFVKNFVSSVLDGKSNLDALPRLLRTSAFSADRLCEMMVLAILSNDAIALATVIAASATHRPRNALPALVLFADWRCAVSDDDDSRCAPIASLLEPLLMPPLGEEEEAPFVWLPERAAHRDCRPLRPLYDTISFHDNDAIVAAARSDLRDVRLAVLARRYRRRTSGGDAAPSVASARGEKRLSQATTSEDAPSVSSVKRLSQATTCLSTSEVESSSYHTSLSF